MTNQELYNELREFRDEVRTEVREMRKELKELIEKKEDKQDVYKSQSTIWRVLFSLFGVNMFGVIILIVSIFLKK
jgi:hypothetical protein